MKKLLDDKIIQAAERAKVEPSKTVVSVDLSNVINWKVLKENVFSINGESKTAGCRVSVPKMSTHFEKLKTHPLVRVFSPHVYIPKGLIEEITEWVMTNSPEMFNSSDFTNPNQSNTGFNTKLVKAIKAYMAANSETAQISANIRAKMSTLTRAETWSKHRKRFRSSGFQVIGKPLNFKNKTLVEDATHVSVVSNVLQVVDDVQNKIESLNELTVDLEETDKIFSRLAGAVEPQQLAEINAIVSHFKDKMVYIGKATEQIKDQILHAPSKKCDLDVDIVTKTLDPHVLNEHGVFVFYSGDGDFRKMYEILHREGKRVIVVSPEGYLARSIKNMAEKGEVEIHKPNFNDNIWREIYVNASNKKST